MRPAPSVPSRETERPGTPRAQRDTYAQVAPGRPALYSLPVVPSTSPLGRLLAALACAGLVASGQAATVVHFAAVQHATCADHGELVHGETAHADAAAPTLASPAIPAVESVALHGSHEHCAACALASEGAQVSVLAFGAVSSHGGAR